jgi:cleavage and polyadenylation specificity factor subunit 1
MEDLRAVFQRLADNGLPINLEKCEFADEELDFLGHRLNAAGVTPLSSRLQVMYDAHGQGSAVICRHCKFLPVVFTKIRLDSCPLTNLLKGKNLPKVLSWEERHDAAFLAAKAALAAAVPLAHPRSDVPLALVTDATDMHKGGVMQQQVGGHFRTYLLCEAHCEKWACRFFFL